MLKMAPGRSNDRISAPSAVVIAIMPRISSQGSRRQPRTRLCQSKPPVNHKSSNPAALNSASASNSRWPGMNNAMASGAPI